MRSAERILASNNTETSSFPCAGLSERYYKTALYTFRLDRTVIPYLKDQLRTRARWYAVHDGWPKRAKDAIESMIGILLYDIEKGGRTTAEFRADALPIVEDAIRSWRGMAERATDDEKAEALGVSLRTWFRVYAKPYDALYADMVGWAMIGRHHVFRMENYEELME